MRSAEKLLTSRVSVTNRDRERSKVSGVCGTPWPLANGTGLAKPGCRDEWSAAVQGMVQMIEALELPSRRT